MNRTWKMLLAASCCAALAFGQQKSFPTARDAAKALVEAARADDAKALGEILGPGSEDLISSGDEVADKRDRTNFVAAYDQQHHLISSGPGKISLTIGDAGRTLPIPIVKTGDHWTFDSAAGKQEILYERIGQNELDTIRVCRALLQAEREYKQAGHDGNPPGAYARRLKSEAGKQNGLYWDTPAGEAPSPSGPLLAEAASDGYNSGPGRHQPFHGYLYRILASQGPHARGGARDYLVDGKMTRGFAVVAYPVEYGASGVMTFMVNQHGAIYQKDLGADTPTEARDIKAFDPDSTWKLVQ